jgi:hypothetical protein
VRPLASLFVALCACTVGPGGSFPDSGGSATTVAMTTTATTASTEDDSGTSDDPSAPSSSASESDDDAGTDAPSDTSSAVSDDDSSSDPSSDPSVDPTMAESSSTDATDTASGTPLDPDLDIPNGGEQCDYPGDLQQCPGIAVCRFATAEYGLCESCDACGNLFDPCVEGTDCDILFSCYAGFCTNFCTLGTFECGPKEDCLDIGHPTRGVCNPFV